MPRHTKLFALLLASCYALLTACGDPDPVGNDEEPDVGYNDVGDQEGDIGDGDDDDDNDPEERLFCDSCISDEDCDEAGAYCVELFHGERVCGAPCTVENPDCPSDSFCASLGEGITQCVPDNLTCQERCDDIACGAGEFCDPLTGECVREARICDTGCQFDSQCGDPEKYACIATGAADGETICTTRCNRNPAEGDDRPCPTDFGCAALVEGADEGVCFPFARTCIDRCQGRSCPAGQNCDPFTGGCVQPSSGPCETGCQIDADCGGQNDMCLNVGIGTGAHCWMDCTETQTCPDGYQCQAFMELSTQLCLPAALQCEPCYAAACHPDGICNPATGECVPHPEDCTIAGCDSGELCEPVSRRCVALDRPCRGESWAADCDNVITRCTTRRADTDGICATLCLSDADCHEGTTCTVTQNGDFCLGPDLGGPMHCGILHPPSATLGRPCGSGAGNCFDPFFCVDDAGVPAFCSRTCTSDATCGAGMTCGRGPDGDSICLPAQCLCAEDPGLAGALNAGWLTALNEAGLSPCAVYLAPHTLRSFSGFSDLVLASEALLSALIMPAVTLGNLQEKLAALDQSSSLSGLLRTSAALLEISVGPSATPPPQTDLVQALQNLAQVSGGTLDTAALSDDLEAVPTAVQTLAARLVAAVATAYTARENAFAAAGLSQSTLETLFEETHRLFLPAADAQSVLDLDDPDLLAALEDFPRDALVQISIDLAHAVETAVSDAALDPADFAGEAFFVVVETPAGLVILGDASDTEYDPAADPNLDAPIALLLDIGGNDTYRLPVAANQSVANGISLLVDLGGDDLYTYEKVGHALDNSSLLPSDEAGRKAPAGALNQNNGPVSLSEVARQGTGRLGVGLLFDFGEGDDTFETLRLGQGAAVLGVGAVFTDGGNDSFEAEAFAQGAALFGIGLLANFSGNDTYRLWHAGQGFGIASGLGLLFDGAGNDQYTAVTGLGNTDAVLYHSSLDSGNVNRSLAQGAATGNADLAAGFGVLRDANGDDAYTAGTFAQGFGQHVGLGLFADGTGDDTVDARGLAQGVGQQAGAGIFLDTGGNDEFNQSIATRQFGQGSGQEMGWGLFLLDGGANTIRYMAPGGGVAFDGGMGFALFNGGPNHHNAAGASMGMTDVGVPQSSVLFDAITAAIFVQTGAQADTYQHLVADQIGITNNAVWFQHSPTGNAVGVGLDQ